MVIKPVDKGRSFVMMARKDYDTKLLEILGDEGTYEKLKKDPTQSLQTKMNEIYS